MEDSPPATPDSPAVPCPGCGQMVPVSEHAPILECSACGMQFFPPDDEGPEAIEAPAEPAPEVDSDAELSGVRIRQISALRRGAYRSRSYCLIAIAALVISAIQLELFSIAEIRRHGWDRLAIGETLIAVVILFSSTHFIRKALDLTHEINRPHLTDPLTPPDFSTLSDGSQHVRNLEEM